MGVRPGTGRHDALNRAFANVVFFPKFSKADPFFAVLYHRVRDSLLYFEEDASDSVFRFCDVHGVFVAC